MTTILNISPTDNIQTAVDNLALNGGGGLALQNGTYTLTQDLVLASSTTLVGASRDSVIIDCDGTYKISIIGTDSYTTGTIAINDGDTTVVGSGTAFTNAMVGQFIILGGLWYEITVRTDNTHIDIASPYSGTNLSGATYAIATINTATTLSNLTVTGATGVGIKTQYTQETTFDNIVVYGCGTGIDMDDTVFAKINVTSTDNGVNLDMKNCWGWQINFSDFSTSTTGAGVVMLSSGNATFFDTAATQNTTNGVSLTSCTGIAFVSNSFDGNTTNGIEFISGNNDCQLYATNTNANGAAGIKLTATSDRISITGCNPTNNGTYGINIAAASCDNNVLTGVIASGNATASLNDSGTGTLKSGTVNIIP